MDASWSVCQSDTCGVGLSDERVHQLFEVGVESVCPVCVGDVSDEVDDEEVTSACSAFQRARRMTDWIVGISNVMGERLTPRVRVGDDDDDDE